VSRNWKGNQKDLKEAGYMKDKLPQDASLRVQIPLVQVLAGELAPAFLNYYYMLVHCLLRSDLRTRKNQSQTMSSR